VELRLEEEGLYVAETGLEEEEDEVVKELVELLLPVAVDEVLIADVDILEAGRELVRDVEAADVDVEEAVEEVAD
jgi:hypothetical protein